eukprot:bmy_09605T0
MYGSILFLTCISADRFLAIVYPFKSKTLRTKRNAKIVCIAVWLTVMGGSAPAVFFQSTHSQVYYFTSDTIQNSIKMKNWSTRRSDSRFSEVQGTENFIQHNLQTLKNKIFDNESTI